MIESRENGWMGSMMALCGYKTSGHDDSDVLPVPCA